MTEVAQGSGLRTRASPAPPGEVEAWCRTAIEAKPDAAEAVRSGNDRALGALIGPALQASGGRADPALVRQTLRRLLA